MESRSRQVRRGRSSGRLLTCTSGRRTVAAERADDLAGPVAVRGDESLRERVAERQVSARPGIVRATRGASVRSAASSRGAAWFCLRGNEAGSARKRVNTRTTSTLRWLNANRGPRCTGPSIYHSNAMPSSAR